MPQGLQVWDASGNLVVDLGDRITRILGMTTITGGSTGDITHAGFATGAIWWQVIMTSSANGGYSPNITPDPANNRIQYSPRGWPATAPTVRIVYGVY